MGQSVSQARTSRTHPLQIATVHLEGGGRIGLTFCPGKYQPDAATGPWDRDLSLDLSAITGWGASCLISLITSAEMDELGVPDLGEAARTLGLDWLHLPIDDVDVPGPLWERAWETHARAIHDLLDHGGAVAVHCKGGLGRAGLVAARLIVERGQPPALAIAQVRAVRPGAVETVAQESYVCAQIALSKSSW